MTLPRFSKQNVLFASRALVLVAACCLPLSAGTITYSTWLETSASVGGVEDSPAYALNLNSTTVPGSATQSAVVGGASGQSTVSISLGNGNVGLHGYASSLAPSAPQANLVASGLANFDIGDSDTFTFTGTGAEVFNYTLTLDGTATAGPIYPDAFGGDLSSFGTLSLLEDPTYSAGYDNSIAVSSGNVTGNYLCQVELNASSPSDTTCDGQLNVQGGQTLNLGLLLIARTGASTQEVEPAGEPPEFLGTSATFDASDTGFLTLTPVTPGAGFTSASGLTYTADPDSPTPEPATCSLVGCAFLAAGLLRRKIRKQKG